VANEFENWKQNQPWVRISLGTKLANGCFKKEKQKEYGWMEKELPQNSTAGIKRLKEKGGGRH
jgi:hypothetical protein